MPDPVPPARFREFLGSFDKGVDSGIDPLLLPNDQLAYAVNASLRGTFAHPRPPFITRQLVYPGGAAIQQAVEQGLWQGAGYYKPDVGLEQLIAQISGRLFTFTPQADNTVTVVEVSIPGDLNSATAPQAWLWQSEKWMIIQNGVGGVNPIFYDGTTSRRSNFSQPVNFNTVTATAPFTIPALNVAVVGVNFADTTSMQVGDVITLKNFGQFVVSLSSNSAPGTATLVNQSAGPINASVPVGTKVTWTHIGTELPPGRMGVYGMGRNWMSLTDGKQFVAGDLVGGPSGTQQFNYRDAVLNITENQYLVGGGNFTVPGSFGEILAMIFIANLDVQLGQGPLLVVTPKVTFSCQAPVDRTTWSSLTNPILTISMIANGGLSQYSTIGVNGDVIMRSIDGIRSFILARRDFNTWGNTPISFEMDRVLSRDDLALLVYSSAIFFDNRLMMTLAPTASPQGVYHKGMVVLNADPVSSVAGKAPSIWEGVWLGLTPLQLVLGTFSTVERAWGFCYNTTLQKIELRELLAEGPAADSKQYYDDGNQPITMILESAQLFDAPDSGLRLFKQLFNGEIFIDQQVGVVDYKVQYQPDQWPGWVDWFEWQECTTPENDADITTQNYKPGFKPRMGLGQPSVVPCEPCNNRPLRLGYSYQIRYTQTGQARFLGARLESTLMPEPSFAPKSCPPIPKKPRLILVTLCGCPAVDFSANITAVQGTPPFTFTFPDGLPQSLHQPNAGIVATVVNDTTVNLFYRNVSADFGTYPFRITVTDALGLSDTQQYYFFIQGPIDNYTNGHVGVPYSSKLHFAGGTPPYTVIGFSPLQTGLPPGLTLAPDSTLSGTPTLAGTYDFNVINVDANGCSCTTEVSLIISP